MTDLREFLDGDDGVWYDRFGLWTQGKRDTAWLAGKLNAAGVTLAPAEGLREALRAVLSDFDRDPTEEYLDEAVRIFRRGAPSDGRCGHGALIDGDDTCPDCGAPVIYRQPPAPAEGHQHRFGRFSNWRKEVS